MLEYKLSWKGGRLVAVPPQNTSRTCPRCGHVSADNRQTQARFVCVACGYENNADVAAAINILSRGIQLLRDEGQDTANALVGMQVDWLPASARMACGSNRVGGRKQEPAEALSAGR
jgi:putative transposase